MNDMPWDEDWPTASKAALMMLILSGSLMVKSDWARDRQTAAHSQMIVKENILIGRVNVGV
jgi:hypothetical protein